MTYDFNEIEGLNPIDAFSEAIIKLGKKYQNLVVLNSDSSNHFKLNQFSKFFDNRFFNFGLAEKNMISASAGFAVRGKIPLITGYSMPLIGKSFEEIRNNICYPNLNIKLVGSHAEFFEDVSLMRVLPNMKVVCPCDYYETLSVLEAMMQDYGPTYIRLFDTKSQKVFDNTYKFEFGKAKVLQEGKDVCIFASGLSVSYALKACELLKKDGINPYVVNVSSIKPIDSDLIIELSKKVNLCVSVEEHSIIGGLGSAILEILGEKNPLRFLKIGIDDKFVESGNSKDLCSKYGIDESGIYKKIITNLDGGFFA